MGNNPPQQPKIIQKQEKPKFTIPPEILKHQAIKQKLSSFSWEGLILDQLPTELRDLIAFYAERKGPFKSSYEFKRSVRVPHTNAMAIDAGGLCFASDATHTNTIHVYRMDDLEVKYLKHPENEADFDGYTTVLPLPMPLALAPPGWTLVHTYQLEGYGPGLSVFDIHGNLVFLGRSARVRTLDPTTGEIISCFRVLHPFSPEQMMFPNGLALQINGDILITCARHPYIFVYSPDGTLKKRIEHPEMTSPFGIAVDTRNGNILITDGETNNTCRSIQAFDSDGKFIRKIGNPDEFFPTGILVDSCGRILVAVVGGFQILTEHGETLLKVDVPDLGIITIPVLDHEGNILMRDAMTLKFQIMG